MKDLSGIQAGKGSFMKSEFFKFPHVSGKFVRHEYGSSRTERKVNLGELWGLLLWVYFMGVPSTVPRSGKPGWPRDGDGGMWPIGRPSCCRSSWMKFSPGTRSRIHRLTQQVGSDLAHQGVAGSGTTYEGRRILDVHGKITYCS